jgi:hypothetical protein
VRPDSEVWTKDRKPVEHAILSQQRGASIQQFIENLNVGNPGMLGRQKYELDRLVTQTAAELPGSADVWPMHSSTTTRSIHFMT